MGERLYTNQQRRERAAVKTPKVKEEEAALQAPRPQMPADQCIAAGRRLYKQAKQSADKQAKAREDHMARVRAMCPHKQASNAADGRLTGSCR